MLREAHITDVSAERHIELLQERVNEQAVELDDLKQKSFSMALRVVETVLSGDIGYLTDPGYRPPPELHVVP
jgi:hypothetical protein